MPASNPAPSPNARDEINRLYGLVRTAGIQRHLWGSLPPEEQRLLDNYLTGLDEEIDTVDLWRSVFGGRQAVVIVELAYRADLITGTCRESLLRELGERVPTAVDQSKPVWDRARGRLTYHGKHARKVAAQARNIRSILGRFHAQGWPDSIEMPEGWDETRVRDTLVSLDKGLARLQFSRRGNTVVWSLLDDELQLNPN